MTTQISTPNGDTRIFAVLGHPVAHSLSPAMHNPALQEMGVNGLYVAFDVHPDELMTVLGAMSHMGITGCNLTIPHKEIAFRGLDQLDDSARKAGSANTVLFHADGRLEGFSTDGYGLRMALEESFGAGFSAKDVLVIGCGGAGRAAAIQAAQEGAAHIRLANRSPERRAALADELRREHHGTQVEELSVWPPKPGQVTPADIILQSTSLGMKPGEPSLLAAEAFREGQSVLDMTYTQRVTPIMRAAMAGGAQAVNGLGMLLHQGVRSLEIWTGRRDVPVEVMRTALRTHMYGGAGDV